MKEEQEDHMIDAMRYMFASLAPKPTWYQKLWNTIRDIARKIVWFLYTLLWKFLWFIRIARFVQQAQCRFNLYQKFRDGRCMWCGEKH